MESRRAAPSAAGEKTDERTSRVDRKRHRTAGDPPGRGLHSPRTMPGPRARSCGPRSGRSPAASRRLPKVGDYVTYDILDESIIVVRTAPDKIAAYLQRLPAPRPAADRGLRPHQPVLLPLPRLDAGTSTARTRSCSTPRTGAAALDDDDIRLKTVKVDTWGGWVWINMDPDCEPLDDYLEPAPAHARPVRAREDALPLAPVARLPVQLEDRARARSSRATTSPRRIPQLIRWGADHAPVEPRRGPPRLARAGRPARRGRQEAAGGSRARPAARRDGQADPRIAVAEMLRLPDGAR